MTVEVEGKFTLNVAEPEIFFWFSKRLEVENVVDELCFTVTNTTSRDKFDDFSATLELSNFVTNKSPSTNDGYWNEKQPFTQKSGYDSLTLVVCYGKPDWLGKKSEDKTITFNPAKKTVFLCWCVDDIAILDSIKSNLKAHKELNLHIVLNEKDDFFAGIEHLAKPKLRSFSLTFV